MEIGIRLAYARREIGMTQRELADKMFVTRQTVSRWESGSVYPDIEKVVRLAEVLHVSCDYLLGSDASIGGAVSEEQSDQEKTDGEKDVGYAQTGALTRLMRDLVGKCVRITFFEDEEDWDVLEHPCYVEGFEGSWMRVIIKSKKGDQKKIIAITSILSFEVTDGEG